MDTKTPGTAGPLVPHSVLTTAAHELRGPIGVTRGYLRLLLKQVAGDAAALKAVEGASQATDRLAALVEEVSLYARLACGEAHLQHDTVSLAAVLAESIEHAAFPSTPRVQARLDCSPDLTVRGDRSRLAQACAGLVTAAAHAQVEDATLLLTGPGSDGHTGFHVTLLRQAGGTSEERPARLDRSGVGLRLAISDLIVRMHGGLVTERWVDNTWAGYVVRL